MIRAKLEEIKQLMNYAVPKEDLAEAFDFLETFQNDIIALNLLHNFYSFLPEGMDDSIKELRLVKRKEGLFLICAVTAINEYLYLVNLERAEFLGLFSEGVFDPELLHFFGYATQEEADKLFQKSSRHPAYTAAYEIEELCPVCAAADGEYHTLGCPVEVCPWCGGQLTSCNCRFAVMGKEHITTEQDLRILEEKLSEKGRIAYDPIDQRPGYPGKPESP